MNKSKGYRMQRLFLLVLVFLALPAFSQTDAPAGHYPPAAVDMQLQRLSEHVYFVQGEAGVATDNKGFISNAGVIVTNDGVVVFDALGTPSLADLLLRKIREVTDQPIVRVISSHYHADHIYGLQVFKERGAAVWAPVGAEKYLQSENAGARLEERRFSLAPWVNETTRLVEPDRYIGVQEDFELGGVRFTVCPGAGTRCGSQQPQPGHCGHAALSVLSA